MGLSPYYWVSPVDVWDRLAIIPLVEYDLLFDAGRLPPRHDVVCTWIILFVSLRILRILDKVIELWNFSLHYSFSLCLANYTTPQKQRFLKLIFKRLMQKI